MVFAQTAMGAKAGGRPAAAGDTHLGRGSRPSCRLCGSPWKRPRTDSRGLVLAQVQKRPLALLGRQEDFRWGFVVGDRPGGVEWGVADEVVTSVGLKWGAL